MDVIFRRPVTEIEVFEGSMLVLKATAKIALAQENVNGVDHDMVLESLILMKEAANKLGFKTIMDMQRWNKIYGTFM